MQRQIFTEEHDAFRETVRAFLTKEALPHYEQWEKDGIVSREAWLAAGRQGLLGLAVPEEYAGGGNTDFRYGAVLAEEFTRAGAPGLALGLHNDIIGPYLTGLGTEEQKRRRDGHRVRRHPYLPRPLHRRPFRRDAGRRACLDGQVVGHRTAEARRRPLPPTPRRIRLHGGVSGRQGVHRRPYPDHLRRHGRDHEGDHRPFAACPTP